MKGKTKISLAQKIIACVLTMQILIMVLLSIVVITRMTAATKSITSNYMNTITQERAEIVKNYVSQTEDILTAFSRAGEITALLKNPTDPAATEAAQKYTEQFSADVANLEGLYASEWNTHVLTHTNPAVVGITTREGDGLKALQDALLAADGVYNTGIIISPASQKQIVSLYRAVFDENGNPIGLVGGGIFTNGLIDILDGLKIKGMDHTKYCMVNVKNGQYIFVDDTEKVATVAEEAYIQQLCSQLSTSAEDTGGIIEHREGDTDYISSYRYMADYGWVFLINHTKGEVYAATNSLAIVLIAFSAIALLALSLISFLCIRRILKPMANVENSISALQNYDIRQKDDIKKYTQRADELGSIAQATESLVTALRDITGTLQSSCEILDSKADNLHTSAVKLTESVTDSVATTEEFSASFENTNSIVQNVNDEILKIDEAVQNVRKFISSSVDTSGNVIGSAQAMRTQAGNAYENGQNTLETTRSSVQEAITSLSSLVKINELAEEILNISGQTNLLSLNASIEAARAGEAGRGFSVVAGEIGHLAETSQNTASAIQQLCEEANKSIEIVNACFTSIISFIEQDVVAQFKDFVAKSDTYSVEVNSIQKQLDFAQSAVQELYDSVMQISENIQNVQTIAVENRAAINTIIEKNETTSLIAGSIQDQSEENRALAKRLESLINKFQRE